MGTSESSSSSKFISWHRLFGVALIDFLRDLPLDIELERDLSHKRQLLDVVIVRRENAVIERRLPDGLENLAHHNLITYKSFREPFENWTMKELMGHYVNYRKQISPSLDDLLPEEEFRLYGVCTRFPRKFAEKFQLEPMTDGVYQVSWGGDWIRLIVLSEIGDGEHNALWRLFSGIPERIQAGATDYRKLQGEASTILEQLFEYYGLEGLTMPYTIEDFRRDYVREHAEELVKDIPIEVRLKNLSSDELLKHISPDEIRKYLERLEKTTGESPEE